MAVPSQPIRAPHRWQTGYGQIPVRCPSMSGARRAKGASWPFFYLALHIPPFILCITRVSGPSMKSLVHSGPRHAAQSSPFIVSSSANCASSLASCRSGRSPSQRDGNAMACQNVANVIKKKVRCSGNSRSCTASNHLVS